MRVLALELSASVGSLALLDEDGQIAQERVVVDNGRTSAWHVAVPALLESTGVPIESIDLFAAGRGPGRYSGLRVAITAMQSLALPGGKPFRAVCSGLALAREWATARPNYERYMVVGDARRQQIWCGLFRPGAVETDWQLTDLEHLPDCIADGTLVGSPDWIRLQPRLGPALQRGEWIQAAVSPSAIWVAKLALAEALAGKPAAAALPVYLHPPVNAA